MTYVLWDYQMRLVTAPTVQPTTRGEAFVSIQDIDYSSKSFVYMYDAKSSLSTLGLNNMHGAVDTLLQATL